jgi:hypothetical protein
MDDFEAITAGLTADARLEQVRLAREILAAADGERTYGEVLRRIPSTEVVSVTTSDGVTLRGRIMRVGAEGIRVAEESDADAPGRRPRRLHEIRLEAVIRVSRGWAR